MLQLDRPAHIAISLPGQLLYTGMSLEELIDMIYCKQGKHSGGPSRLQYKHVQMDSRYNSRCEQLPGHRVGRSSYSCVVKV